MPSKKGYSSVNAKLKELDRLLSSSANKSKKQGHHKNYAADTQDYHYDGGYSESGAYYEPLTSLLKMVALNGNINERGVPLSIMSVKKFPLPHFSANVEQCLRFMGISTSDNIKEANYIKRQVFKFVDTNGSVYKIDKALPFSFETIWDYEMQQGNPDEMLQRIIISLLLSLEDYKTTTAINTQFGNSISVAIIGCVAGICQYIDKVSGSFKKYSHIAFKADLPYIKI